MLVLQVTRPANLLGMQRSLRYHTLGRSGVVLVITDVRSGRPYLKRRSD
jgi:hypothetical protein